MMDGTSYDVLSYNPEACSQSADQGRLWTRPQIRIPVSQRCPSSSQLPKFCNSSGARIWVLSWLYGLRKCRLEPNRAGRRLQRSGGLG